MDFSVLDNYIDKVYGYAVNRTLSRDEADELAQEILFTAVKELPKLRNVDSFEPWLWGIANNITRMFRRSQGKQREFRSFDTLEAFAIDDQYEFINEEIFEQLRAKVAMLSKSYRDVIVLHYFDNLTTKQIASKLGIPEGTVTWRLSEGRGKLKKECMKMTKTALRPMELELQINGEGDYNGTSKPFPYEFIRDALSQNILYHAYLKPKTVEELAKLCGVPAYYIEDAITNLVKRDALISPVKGRFQTNFMIYDDRTSEYAASQRGLFEPLVEDFLGALGKLTSEVLALGIYTAGRAESELIYLFGLLALEILSIKYNPISFIPYSKWYDGNKWSYHAHLKTNSKYPVRGLGREESANLGSRGSYKYISYHFGGFKYRRMMFDYQVNVCEDIISGKPVEDKESAARAIKDGFIKRCDDGKLVVTVPAFTKEQKELFDKKVETYFAGVIDKYANVVKEYVIGYKKLFPRHLEDDVLRASNYLFVVLFATDITDLAQGKGLLVKPIQDSVCDCLIQYK